MSTLDSPPVPVRSHRRLWIAALDGYRGLAVLVVVAFHQDLLDGGWLGVDLFFVLSGLLITRVVMNEHRHTGGISLSGFWARRARRLLPAFVAFMVGVAVFVWWYPEPAQLPASLFGEAVASVAYVANWFTLTATGGYWQQYAVASPLRHVWSLSIEEQFYIVFPLVVVGLVAWRGRRVLGWVLAALTVGSWSLALGLLASGTSFERVYLGTDTRLAAITLGALAGWATTTGSAGWLVRWCRVVAVPALAVAAVLMVTLAGDTVWTPWRWLAVIVFEVCVTAVLVVAVGEPDRGEPSGDPQPGVPVTAEPVTNRIMSVGPLVWFGTISYGLYLWHIPVGQALGRVAGDLPVVVAAAVTLAVASGLAWLSYRFIERPVRLHGLAAFGPSPLRRVAAVLVAIALVAGSLAVVWSASAPARQLDSLRAEGPSQVVTENVDGTLGVLVIGDSMVEYLTPNLLNDQQALGMSASVTSLVGCGAGGINTSAEDPGLTEGLVAACDRWLAGLPALVAETDPDVVLVVRVARRLPSEVTGGGDVCSDGYRQWYRQALIDEIGQLSATGATVAMTTAVYNRFGDASVSAWDDSVDCANEELRAAAEATGAKVVELGAWTCPTHDTCRTTTGDGVELRPDGVHFSGPGGSVALAWILEQVRAQVPGR